MNHVYLFILPLLICTALAVLCAMCLLSGHASFILILPLAWIAGEKAYESYKSSRK